MAFTKKRISVTFTLSPVTDPSGNVTAQPKFAGSNSNSVTLDGYRISAQIVKAGGASQGEAHLRIFGMTLDLMNQLSTLGRTPVIIGRNEIAITAGEAGAQSLVFRGTISQAFTNLGGAPEGVFEVDAYSMLYQAVQSIPPTSFRGAVDAALILQGLATQMGLNFENNGASAMLSNPYFAGSAKTQSEAVVHAANFEWNAGDNGTLAIWPRGGARASGQVPLIAAKTGMVGYPFPSGQGLLGVKTAFNPQINFGAKVEVQSTIKPACGTWTVCNLTHDIEAEMPGGQWFTTLVGTPPGYLAVR